MLSATPPARYLFGVCELDARSRTLRVAGETRHVEPKTFDLILYLLEHRDRVVTKRELNDALWGGYVVSDGALTQCVWTARRAIGDARPRGAMIQTHNGVGYRFAGDVLVRPAPFERAARVSGEYPVIDSASVPGGGASDPRELLVDLVPLEGEGIRRMG